MFFQDAPPDTSSYMIAGYVLFFAIGLIYVFSLAIRRRNLEQDLQTLERIAAEAKAGQPTASKRGRKPVKKATRKK